MSRVTYTGGMGAAGAAAERRPYQLKYGGMVLLLTKKPLNTMRGSRNMGITDRATGGAGRGRARRVVKSLWYEV